MGIPQLEMPASAVARQPEVTLPDQVMDDRLQNILARRAFVPDNPEIEQELVDLLDDVEVQALQALEDDDIELAARLAGVITTFDEQRPVVARINEVRDRRAEIQRLLGQAEQALGAGNLVQPADASAWVLFEQVLAIDAENQRAQDGLESVSVGLFARVDELLEQSSFEAAAELLDVLGQRGLDETEIAARRDLIASGQEDQQRALINAVRVAIDDGQFEQAEENINELIGLGAQSEQIANLRSSLDDAIEYGGFEPGQLFQDGLGNGELYGPVMVVVPSGSFMMGAPDDEDDRMDREGPRFRVNFERGFGLARTEVTVAQFRAFVDATGYQTDAERNGSSRIYVTASGRVGDQEGIDWRQNYLGQPAEDSLPVLHVSWNDASAYAQWLAQQTGRPYRLPSEAEFEYALRAGTQSRYWWGDDRPDDPTENVTGDGDRFTDQRTWTGGFRRYSDGFWGPAPVGSLQANSFGLYDMGGNVMEWVRDCWHDSYVRAPVDGSHWVNPGCDRRVIRGASWTSSPAMSRSAYRLASSDDTADARVGFRVARDL
ncbi:MAG: SUMF1/EgtB/PvdO family nonheme iron enzyme [Wenzhouxiangellaceae bacterium]|nr:SUMF1/EgtB/PvdO family nonheme iron enzyme [Wenzhouxiangellaceae bacterium]